jgi:arsenite methyltransferase
MHEPSIIKACCADLYSSEVATWLLGDSLHPGGMELTRELAELLGITPDMTVLDVAAGRGESAIFLAECFGCRVIGVDFSPVNVAAATEAARRSPAGDHVQFIAGDAEHLPMPDGVFDAVMCECAFCTFPNKSAAALELSRVLRDGGMIGVSDLTRSGPLPPEIDSLLGWILCVADARPASDYRAILTEHGFRIDTLLARDDCLKQLVDTVRARLLVAKVLTHSQSLGTEGFNIDTALAIARSIANAVEAGLLGYALLAGGKPRVNG